MFNDYTVEDSRKCWNNNAKYWSRELRKGNDITRDHFMLPAFLDHCPDLRRKRVLDVGCGDGSIARIINNRGALVTGVDFSENMIDLAKSLSKAYDINYTVGSAAGLTKIFHKSEFDVIISFMVLHSVDNLASFFHQASEILSERGEIYFLTAHPCFRKKKSEYLKNRGIVITGYFNSEIEYVKWDFGRFEKNNMEDIRFPWKLEDYINGLANAGFSIDKIIEPCPTKAAIKLLPSLEKWTHAAHSLIVKASKR